MADTFKRGQVVSYTRTDALAGKVEGIGVVLGAGSADEAVVIRPLSVETLFVPAADVQLVEDDDDDDDDAAGVVG